MGPAFALSPLATVSSQGGEKDRMKSYKCSTMAIHRRSSTPGTLAPVSNSGILGVNKLISGAAFVNLKELALVCVFIKIY